MPASASAQATGATASGVQALITSLKNPKLTAEERQKIVDQLLQAGDEGPRQLAVYAAAEVQTRRDAHITKFNRALAAVLTARLKANGGAQKMEQEIDGLRRQSLAVSRSKNLTEDTIKTKCDPAIKRLTELLSITQEQALEQQPDLKASREEVLDSARIYQTAFEKVPAAKQKGIPVVEPPESLEQDLSARERMMLLLALPMPKGDRDVLQANIGVAVKIDAEEAAAIAEVNRLRVLLGIGALTIDPKLCTASRDHSKDMKEMNFFDHTSPIKGKETAWKRAAQAGTSANAENIYEAAKGAWMRFGLVVFAGTPLEHDGQSAACRGGAARGVFHAVVGGMR